MAFSQGFIELLKTTLIQKGKITEEQFHQALELSMRDNSALDECLTEKTELNDEDLGKIIASLLDTQFVKPADRIISEITLNTIPYPFAESRNVIVFEKNDEEVKIATSDPENQETINFIEKKTGLPVKIYYTLPRYIREGLKLFNRDVNKRFNKLLEGVLEDPHKIESLEDASKILDTIISFAVQSRASDIHIEPQGRNVLVRYRIDGLLQDIVELPKQIEEFLITRIKVLSNLPTDEHRAAQDGRFKMNVSNAETTLRVSIIPVYEGEKGVLRILAAQKQSTDLENLGFSQANLAIMNDNIRKNQGIILVTGPTGSGKTTTLYTILKKLNTRAVNIETIEDPIEYRLPGINQIQVNNKTGLTFAHGLRALLRQDPDIIMVGEIRDEETASIAINSALTGHLVLATLHTNSAAATLPRLTEMGIETFLVASTINMTLAQRLVRTICEKCKEEFPLTREELENLSIKIQLNARMIGTLNTELGLTKKNGVETIKLYRGKGCSLCGNTGFKGRTCIVEIIDVDDEIKELILRNTPPNGIEKNALEKGMKTMFQDGIKKALEGITTIEEVLRVIRD